MRKRQKEEQEGAWLYRNQVAKKLYNLTKATELGYTPIILAQS